MITDNYNTSITLVEKYLCGKISIDCYKETYEALKKIAELELLFKKYCNKFNLQQRIYDQTTW